jgi:hypothetical protein
MPIKNTDEGHGSWFMKSQKSHYNHGFFRQWFQPIQRISHGKKCPKFMRIWRDFFQITKTNATKAFSNLQNCCNFCNEKAFCIENTSFGKIHPWKIHQTNSFLLITSHYWMMVNFIHSLMRFAWSLLWSW